MPCETRPGNCHRVMSAKLSHLYSNSFDRIDSKMGELRETVPLCPDRQATVVVSGLARFKAADMQ